jgi:hypothetical protein
VWLDSRGANRLVQVGVLLSIALIAFLYIQDRQQADCIARYNEANAQVSRERTQATNSDWAALDDLARAVADGGNGRAAAQAYLDNRTNTLKQRADHQLVPPPSDYCS